MAESSTTVMILPGGAFQLSLVRKAKARGWRTIVTDMDPNCACGGEADLFRPIGINDWDALLAVAREFRPDGIVTDQTDAGVPVVAALAAAIGRIGIGEEASRLFTNKALMRSFGRKHGFPTPDFRSAATMEAARAAALAIGYPVVVKPPASQSSNGVHVVSSESELEAAFLKAQGFSQQDAVIVEQFIDGTEFTVEGFKSPDGHRTLAISQKAHFATCPTVACSLRYTPDNPNFDYDRLACQHDAMINGASLAFGITHAEYKFARGDFYLIEFAARGGGTRIASDIVPWVSGVDVQQALLYCVLGEEFPDIPEVPMKRCALLEFLDAPPGRLVAVEGLETVAAMHGVCEVKINCAIGATIPSVASDTSRPGYFILQTETEAELDALRARVLSTFRLVVEESR